MATSYSYQKTIRNPVLGLSKTIKAHTQEELDVQIARQEEIWEREVKKKSGEVAALLCTQEERQRRDVLLSLLKEEVKKGVKPGWKRSKAFLFPPFLYEDDEPAPTVEQSAKLFPHLPDYFPLLPRFLQPEITEEREAILDRIQQHYIKAKREYAAKEEQARKEYEELRRHYNSQQDDEDAIQWVLDVILEDLQFPYELGTNAQIGFDEPDGPDETDLTVVVEMFLPREEDMPNVAEYKYNTRLDEIVPIMLKQRERSDNYEELVAQTALATMFRVFHDAQTPRIQRIIFNGYVDGIHAATGQPFQRCVLTVEWTRQDFEQRDLSQVKAVKCLHDLRGLTAGPLVDVSPVTPIRVLSNRDDRFVDIRDVLANHPSASNIATMPWRDFEHLVATLFQKMYGESGEVHLTRTSRDRGVDALVLDRDPLRGGRIVIQAKQYPNRLVPPAHVRELLGTMTHERATRGALVTTGYFSSDSKEYAEEHNIMLYEGPQLLDMLLKHGFQVTYQV